MENKQIMKKVYKKLSATEHMDKRSSMYMGNTNNITKKEWILEESSMVFKEIEYNPGLLKLIDEIISNSIDHYKRENTNVTKIKVSIKDNEISVFNNGSCIPIEKDLDEDMYIPTLVFGQPFTSSNFDDDDKRLWVGTNGLGSKLVNLKSDNFLVETYNHKEKLFFSQLWEDNKKIEHPPRIEKKTNFKEDFTQVTFTPSLKEFNMQTLYDNSTLKLVEKKLHDTSACCPNLKVYYNDDLISYKSFKHYIKSYTAKEDVIVNLDIDTNIEIGIPNAIQILDFSIIIPEDKQSYIVSFVNNCFTPDNGTHVDFILNPFFKQLITELNKKKSKEFHNMTTAFLKKKLKFFINTEIVNPSYSSQMKTELINNFKKKNDIDFSDIIKKIKDNKIFLNSLKETNVKKINSEILKGSGKKIKHVKGVDKLEDANYAGTNLSENCILILTEGDSAKALAVKGISSLKQDKNYYGVFPLRGKPINTRDSTLTEIKKNKEIEAIVKILGLEYNKEYNEQNIKSLRYGKLRLMTDQDKDGSHIKGLILNIFSTLWPSLLKIGFIDCMITPIIKVVKKQKEILFYNLYEFNNWEKDNKGYSIKYYKGLGTSEDKEAKTYFANPNNIVPFKNANKKSLDSLEMAFGKKNSNLRKTWVENYLVNKEKVELENTLYLNSFLEKEDRSIDITDFIDKELVHYAVADNKRSIPNLMDGFKPTERKVIYTVKKLSMNSKRKEKKVEQLSGFVSSGTNYQHGEDSIKKTIIAMAQSFVGSNNINLLMPSGQFGTRNAGGKDHAAPRYIYTYMNELTELIFKEEDELILNYNNEEDEIIEPVYYVPIIPMILINGCLGIGYAWSTKILSYHPIEIINEIINMIKTGEESKKKFLPWVNNYKSIFQEYKENSFITNAKIYIKDSTCQILIVELPIGLWTENFTKFVNEKIKMFDKTKEDEDNYILNVSKQDYEDGSICFLLDIETDYYNKNFKDNYDNIFKTFKLYKLIKNKYILFDENEVLKEYKNVNEIINNFFKIRYSYYQKRKERQIIELEKKILIIKNQTRYNQEVVDKIIKIEEIENEDDFIELLKNRKYNKHPDFNTYDYLMDKKVRSLTKQNVETLYKNQLKLEKELEIFKKIEIEEMWIKELEILKKYLINVLLEPEDKTPILKTKGFEEIVFSKENFTDTDTDTDTSPNIKNNKNNLDIDIDTERERILNFL